MKDCHKTTSSSSLPSISRTSRISRLSRFPRSPLPLRLILSLLILSIFPTRSHSSSHSHSQNQLKLSSLYTIYANANANTNTNSSSKSSPIPRRAEAESPKIKRSSLWEIKGSDLETTASASVRRVKVESLTFFQSLLRNIAAVKVREKLAEVSSQWASKAQEVVSQKYSEVIRLTSETQEAEIQRLRQASTAQLLNEAVSKATRVYESSLSRFRILAAAAEAAERTVKAISEALSLVLYIYSVRDKWAREERARAFRLSTLYLRRILEELKATVEFAQTAEAVVTVTEMKQEEKA